VKCKPPPTLLNSVAEDEWRELHHWLVAFDMISSPRVCLQELAGSKVFLVIKMLMEV
jgi:hypothetical protein